MVLKMQQQGRTRDGNEEPDATYSSRTKLPIDMPPQLRPAIRLPFIRLPFIRLPPSDSRRLRLERSRFELLTHMGLGPVLTNEPCRPRVMAVSRPPAFMMEESQPARSAAAMWRLETRRRRAQLDSRETERGIPVVCDESAKSGFN